MQVIFGALVLWLAGMGYVTLLLLNTPEHKWRLLIPFGVLLAFWAIGLSALLT